MQAETHPLKMRRLKLDKSLTWLREQLAARGVKVSKASLSRIENCKQTVNPDMLPHLAELVGLSPEEARPDLAEVFSKERAS